MNERVLVLMSTYNGEKYIKEQLDSVFSQKDVKIDLFVRDDGSTDNTLKILYEYRNKNSNHITIVKGRNVGYSKSFFYLISNSQLQYDYYAFADQDDVWLEDKLVQAIHVMKDTEDNTLQVYTSDLTIVDEKLNFISEKNMPKIDNLQGIFTRCPYAGCTMVITKRMMEMLKKIPSHYESVYSHDFNVCALCLASGNRIYVDNKSKILHRRVAESVTCGGVGWKKRMKKELNLFFGRKYSHCRIAKQLLQYNSDDLTLENRKFLQTVAEYPSSVRNYFKLLILEKGSSDRLLFNVMVKIKILFRLF